MKSKMTNHNIRFTICTPLCFKIAFILFKKRFSAVKGIQFYIKKFDAIKFKIKSYLHLDYNFLKFH